jgi:hypothetical protein
MSFFLALCMASYVYFRMAKAIIKDPEMQTAMLSRFASEGRNKQ